MYIVVAKEFKVYHIHRVSISGSYFCFKVRPIKRLVRPYLLLLKTDHPGDGLVTGDLDGPPPDP